MAWWFNRIVQQVVQVAGAHMSCTQSEQVATSNVWLELCRPHDGFAPLSPSFPCTCLLLLGFERHQALPIGARQLEQHLHPRRLVLELQVLELDPAARQHRDTNIPADQRRPHHLSRMQGVPTLLIKLSAW